MQIKIQSYYSSAYSPPTISYYLKDTFQAYGNIFINFHDLGHYLPAWFNFLHAHICTSSARKLLANLHMCHNLFGNSHACTMEKAMAPHSNTLTWRIPWMEKAGRLQSMGSLRVRHNWATSLSLFTFMHWRRKWQPTPVFLPGEPQGQRNLLAT